jgi:hypothetical protein
MMPALRTGEAVRRFGGRPKLPDAERLSVYALRLKPADIERLEFCARRRRTSPTELIRELIVQLVTLDEQGKR